MDISATQSHIFKASKMAQQVRAQNAEPNDPSSVLHIHKRKERADAYKLSYDLQVGSRTHQGPVGVPYPHKTGLMGWGHKGSGPGAWSDSLRHLHRVWTLSPTQKVDFLAGEALAFRQHWSPRPENMDREKIGNGSCCPHAGSTQTQQDTSAWNVSPAILVTCPASQR